MGGLGGARFGTRLDLELGGFGESVPDVYARGIGGGALGFSKLVS